MSNVIKVFYWSIGAILFVGAVSLLMYADKILNEEYKNILYERQYFEVTSNMR